MFRVFAFRCLNSRWVGLGLVAVAVHVAGSIAQPSSAQAGSRYSDSARISSERVYVPRSRSGARVKGFSRRVGGYSYRYDDAITSYTDDNILSDPRFDRQGGPFDSGFFFDSGAVAPHLSSDPYP